LTEIIAHHGIFKDTALHVEDTGGPGRPVVLLHGWPLSAESWKDNVPALVAAGHRVIAYDRRGFGRSDKPKTGYKYDTFAEDLQKVLEGLDVRDATLVGFSMGGGEVARYLANYGPERIRSAVFAGAVTPYLEQTSDNPDGPLTKEQAGEFTAELTADQEKFYDKFTTLFFSVDDRLVVSEAQRQEALALALQADKNAALQSMAAWGTTDFRDDVAKVTVPTLVIHGDSDALVPFEGSGARTHAAIPQSELVVVQGGPHGFNVSHADEFNAALTQFLAR
jgi:pimeloyl-ACP methyl ester carboxylesterase